MGQGVEVLQCRSEDIPAVPQAFLPAKWLQAQVDIAIRQNTRTLLATNPRASPFLRVSFFAILFLAIGSTIC